jgi:hypothetical protein
MKALWQRSASPRQPPLALVTIEGTVLPTPMEHHQNSRWLVLQTEQGRLVRVVVSRSASIANWLEPGQPVGVRGRVTEKQWTDGPHATVSAHEDVQILKGDMTMYGGVRV